MLKTLIVGSIALDSVKTPFGEVRRALGGSGSYASCAASLLAPVRLVGVVGDDFPKEHLDTLAGRGVDLAGVQRIAGGKTFHWAGYYEYDMAQAHTTATELNVFAQFEPTIPLAHRSTEIVFLANIQPTLQLRVLEQMDKPVLSMCDTMNFWIENTPDDLRRVLSRVDVALMNDAEARELTNEPSIFVAGRKVLELGPRYAVIKKGAHGALLISRDTCFAIPSYPLWEVRDPTGAGDSFAGGIAGYLARTGDVSEPNLRRAIAVGTCLASFCCEAFSLERLKSVTKEELRRRYEELQRVAAFGGLQMEGAAG
ncbi:MAG: PfkB family carbohydrate kinase [Armatimonadota bacterium]